MIRVNIQEAKTHLSRYVDRVEQGDVIIVCRHNRPVAELRAVEAAPERPARGRIGAFEARERFEAGQEPRQGITIDQPSTQRRR